MHSVRFKSAIVLVTAALMLYAGAAFADTPGYVNGEGVRFRSGPGTSYSVICSCSKGKALTIISTDGEWTCCSIDGVTGYISSNYVSAGYYSTGSSPTITIGTPGSQTVTVTAAPQPVPAALPEVRVTPAPRNTYPPAQRPASTTLPVYVPSATALPVYVPAATTLPTSSPVGIAAASTGSVGYITGDYVRFRTGPSTSYSIITMFRKGTQVLVGTSSGGWTKCTEGGKTGFVSSEYVSSVSPLGSSASVTVTPAPTAAPLPTPYSTQAPVATLVPAPTATPAPAVPVNLVTYPSPIDAYIIGNNVRFRSGPSLSAEILGEFYYANTVLITGESGDWYAATADGRSGYVYKQYVQQGSFALPAEEPAQAEETPSTGETAQPVVQENPVPSTVTGNDVVNYALGFVGCKYSWGGTSPDTGFDCSGFVQYVYQHFGIQLNRVAADQASNGTHVDADSLQPGDILCFYTGASYIGHVGIYIGGGKFVHAATSTTGVIITELSGLYATRGFEARRIV